MRKYQIVPYKYGSRGLARGVLFFWTTPITFAVCRTGFAPRRGIVWKKRWTHQCGALTAWHPFSEGILNRINLNGSIGQGKIAPTPNSKVLHGIDEIDSWQSSINDRIPLWSQKSVCMWFDQERVIDNEGVFFPVRQDESFEINGLFRVVVYLEPLSFSGNRLCGICHEFRDE